MAFPIDQAVTYGGQSNNAGYIRKDLLDLYGGEVLKEYHVRNKFMPLHRVKTLANGRSFDFPLIGTAGARYHTPGELIQADQIPSVTRRVTVDQLLISPVFIDRLEERLTHWEERSIYAQECATGLSDVADRDILRMVARAAFITDASGATAEGLTPLFNETFTENVTVTQPDIESLTGKDIVQAIQKARTIREQHNIYSEAVVALPPAVYNKLFEPDSVNSIVWLNNDVVGQQGGSWSMMQAPTIAGFRLISTNNFPMTDQTTTLSNNDPIPTVGSGEPGVLDRTKMYKGDYSSLFGLVFGRDAVATVKVADLAVESEYQLNRQGTLVVAKYAMGHNILRPCEAQALELTVNKAAPVTKKSK